VGVVIVVTIGIFTIDDTNYKTTATTTTTFNNNNAAFVKRPDGQWPDIQRRYTLYTAIAI